MSTDKKIEVIRTLAPHKDFFSELKEVSGAHKTHKILSGATTEEIDALLTLIHNCVVGLIPIPAELISKIIKAKRMLLLRHRFELSTTFALLLKDGRPRKIALLMSIQSLLPALVGIIA